MTRILFADRMDIIGLALLRALGRQGDHCDVAWHHGPLRQRLRSRFVSRVHDVTPPSEDPGGYARDVVKQASAENYDIVMPIYPDRLRALLVHEPEFARTMPALIPTLKQLELAENKVAMEEHVRSLGLDTPRTFPVATEGDLRHAMGELEFPVVLKAVNAPGGSSKQVRFANNRDELLQVFADLSDGSSNDAGWHVQEFIPGYLHDAFSLWHRGELVQMHTNLRKLMFPITGGLGASALSTHSEELNRLCSRILESLDWHGPAGMEFKHDPRDGRFKFIELNPRFWGSLDSSLQLGLDFAGKYRDLVLGKPVLRNEPYTAGICYRWVIERGPFSFIQQWVKLGFRELFDPQEYVETNYDFDIRDPLPEIPRIATSLKQVLSGACLRFNMNLPAKQVNRFACTLPLEYPSPDPG